MTGEHQNDGGPTVCQPFGTENRMACGLERSARNRIHAPRTRPTRRGGERCSAEQDQHRHEHQIRGHDRADADLGPDGAQHRARDDEQKRGAKRDATLEHCRKRHRDRDQQERAASCRFGNQLTTVARRPLPPTTGRAVVDRIDGPDVRDSRAVQRRLGRQRRTRAVSTRAGAASVGSAGSVPSGPVTICSKVSAISGSSCVPDTARISATAVPSGSAER